MTEGKGTNQRDCRDQSQLKKRTGEVKKMWNKKNIGERSEIELQSGSGKIEMRGNKEVEKPATTKIIEDHQS
jgi:hypothetical protein